MSSCIYLEAKFCRGEICRGLGLAGDQQGNVKVRDFGNGIGRERERERVSDGRCRVVTYAVGKELYSEYSRNV